jgi:hypothetical protein
MGLSAKNVKRTGGGYEPLDDGLYLARLIEIVDFGIQPQRAFRGKQKLPMQHVCLTYELADEYLPDENGEPNEEKPRVISEILPLHDPSAQRAKSNKRYMALDPKNQYNWEWEGLLGTPVSLTVVTRDSVNTGRTYANIDSVSLVREKQAAMIGEPVNELRYFYLQEPDLEVFHALNPWKQQKILDSIGYERTPLAKLLPVDYTPADTRSDEERDLDEPQDQAKKAAAARRAQRQVDEDDLDDEIPY